ncbi:hypothetical protein [Caldimonas tepidiphila]|uniref:hypothetical protein n=1 Tax=Caldimonas tepidiphila TaxID=2315841 RepID=UPI000E5AA0C6|nr:hypothetical protein [Caldimonas tepidiphila]
MYTEAHAANPFFLMLDPLAVVSAVERSDGLAALNSRVYRPLDKPLLPAAEARPASGTTRRAGDAQDEAC